LGVRAVRVAERGDEQASCVHGIDRDLRNLLRVGQAEMCPRGARVNGLVDAIAGREIRAVKAFAGPDVDDVRIGGGNGDRANGAGGWAVEERHPGGAEIGGLPHTAVNRAYIEGGGLVGDASGSLRSAATKRSDVPPTKLLEGRDVNGS